MRSPGWPCCTPTWATTSAPSKSSRLATEKNPNEHTLVALADGLRADARLQERGRRAQAGAGAAARQLRVCKRGLAEDLMLRDQLDEALKHLPAARGRRAPRTCSPQLRIAEIYRAKHDYAKAREALNKAKALDPQASKCGTKKSTCWKPRARRPRPSRHLKTLLDETANRRLLGRGRRATAAMLLERLGQPLPQRRASITRRWTPSADRAARHLEAPRVAVQIVDTYRAAKDLSSASVKRTRR